jgi:hypothetical protein
MVRANVVMTRVPGPVAAETVSEPFFRADNPGTARHKTSTAVASLLFIA